MSVNVVEPDVLVLTDITKCVLHSALRKYYFVLLSQYKVYEEHYNQISTDFLCVFGEVKRLLRFVFVDDVVIDEKYTELPF